LPLREIKARCPLGYKPLQMTRKSRKFWEEEDDDEEEEEK
jgi:hypothetical protein